MRHFEQFSNYVPRQNIFKLRINLMRLLGLVSNSVKSEFIFCWCEKWTRFVIWCICLVHYWCLVWWTILSHFFCVAILQSRPEIVAVEKWNAFTAPRSIGESRRKHLPQDWFFFDRLFFANWVWVPTVVYVHSVWKSPKISHLNFGIKNDQNCISRWLLTIIMKANVGLLNDVKGDFFGWFSNTVAKFWKRMKLRWSQKLQRKKT